MTSWALVALLTVIPIELKPQDAEGKACKATIKSMAASILAYAETGEPVPKAKRKGVHEAFCAGGCAAFCATLERMETEPAKRVAAQVAECNAGGVRGCKKLLPDAVARKDDKLVKELKRRTQEKPLAQRSGTEAVISFCMQTGGSGCATIKEDKDPSMAFIGCETGGIKACEKIARWKAEHPVAATSSRMDDVTPRPPAPAPTPVPVPAPAPEPVALIKSCLEGIDSNPCYNLSELASNAGKYDEQVDWLQEACTARLGGFHLPRRPDEGATADSCYYLTDRLSALGDASGAKVAIKAGCSLKSPNPRPGCEGYEKRLEQLKDLRAFEVKTAEALCADGKHIRACENAVTELTNKKRNAEAQRLAEAACNKHPRKRCQLLAQFFQKTGKAKESHAAAERGCKANDPGSCYETQEYKKACELPVEKDIRTLREQAPAQIQACQQLARQAKTSKNSAEEKRVQALACALKRAARFWEYSYEVRCAPTTGAL